MKYRINVLAAIMIMTLPFHTSAQVLPFSLKGRISDTSGKAVDGANVMFRRPGGKSMIGFTLSGPDGTYELTVSTDADTLQVIVSGFNISSHSRTVMRKTCTMDFTVAVQEQRIREARVSADPIRRDSDTITYYVSQFKEETDRSIGDVLHRMPGIEVTSNGGIKYNGRSINKFYIEGMDMLGGRYGIATNNIQASDIATVEVYEGHQPLKVLQGWVHSDEAALNLRLRQGARGTWNGTMEAGGGYRPALWKAGVSPMMFGRDFQTILTYKTNNIGNDVGRELESQYGGFEFIPALIGCVSPQIPPLDEGTWLQNRIHAASANGILKLDEDSDITAKVHFIHDDRQSSGRTGTEYFVPGMVPFSVAESTRLGIGSDKLGLEFQYRLNSRKRYLLDEVSVRTERTEELGTVDKDGCSVAQVAELPFFSAVNNLQYVRTVGDLQLTFRSITSFSGRNSSLDISPNLYGGIFGQRDTVRQDISSTKLYSTNSVVTSYRTGRLILGLSAQADIDMESFSSELAPADSMRNDISWKRLDAGIGASLSFDMGRLAIDMQSPVKYVQINDHGFPVVEPSLSARLKASRSLVFRASASCSNSFSSLYDSFGGYVMTNYRNISSQGGRLNRTMGASAAFEASYSNAIHAFFADGRIFHTKQSSELTYGMVYDGDFMTMKQYEIGNENDATVLSIDASKRFQHISTTVKAGTDASISHSQYLRQDQLMPVTVKTMSADWGLDTRIGNILLISYSGVYSVIENGFGESASARVRTMRQHVTAGLMIGRHLTAKASLRHYHNDRNEGIQKHLAFLNAGMSYRKGRVEYALDAGNIFNTKVYSDVTFSANTIYTAEYDLRPASLLLSVRFSLR